jgi:xylulokinase
LWRQIQADVYGHEVELLAAEEGAAYGAALLAGVGAKFWKSVDEACDAVVKVQKRLHPDPSASKALQTQYDKYRMLYPALKPLFARSRPAESVDS